MVEAQDVASPILTREDADIWLFAMLASESLTLGMKALGSLLRARLNFETGQLNPSIGHLAAGTCQCTRSVEKQLDGMRAAGFLVWEGGRGRSSRRYRLCFVPALEREIEEKKSRRQAEILGKEFPPVRRGIPAERTRNSRPSAGRTLEPIEPLRGAAPRAPDGAAVAARIGEHGPKLLDQIGPAMLAAWFPDVTIEGDVLIVPNQMKANRFLGPMRQDLDAVLPRGWTVKVRAKGDISNAA